MALSQLVLIDHEPISRDKIIDPWFELGLNDQLNAKASIGNRQKRKYAAWETIRDKHWWTWTFGDKPECSETGLHKRCDLFLRRGTRDPARSRVAVWVKKLQYMVPSLLWFTLCTNYASIDPRQHGKVSAWKRIKCKAGACGEVKWVCQLPAPDTRKFYHTSSLLQPDGSLAGPSTAGGKVFSMKLGW